jgi:hypothetical protein
LKRKQRIDVTEKMLAELESSRFVLQKTNFAVGQKLLELRHSLTNPKRCDHLCSELGNLAHCMNSQVRIREKIIVTCSFSEQPEIVSVRFGVWGSPACRDAALRVKDGQSETHESFHPHPGWVAEIQTLPAYLASCAGCTPSCS